MTFRDVIIFTIINSSYLFPTNNFSCNGLTLNYLSNSSQKLLSRSRSYCSSYRLLSSSLTNSNNDNIDGDKNGYIYNEDRISYDLNLNTNSKNRRSFLSQMTSTVVSTVFTSSASAASDSPMSLSLPALETSSEVTWPLGKVAFSLLPLSGTYNRRATIQETIIPDLMWTHDQVQGVVNVNVPVRETIIKVL